MSTAEEAANVEGCVTFTVNFAFAWLRKQPSFRAALCREQSLLLASASILIASNEAQKHG
jgi:hypothetical protein